MVKEWKVLLIDDDPSILKVTALALKNSGYTVITAPDGETGLDLCRSEHPHIIITDIGLPGMDGLEVLKRIKEMDADREVIVSTAFTEVDLAIKAMQLDASGFVTKPVNFDSLATAVQRAKERYVQRMQTIDYTSLMEEKWIETADKLGRTFLFQKMLIEASMDGIAGCNKRGKIIIYNPSLERMLGYSKEAVIGHMSLLDLFAQEEVGKFQDDLYSEQPTGGRALFRYKSRLTRCDGVNIPVMLSASVLFQGEEQIGIVAFFRQLDETVE